jgi:Ion channel
MLHIVHKKLLVVGIIFLLSWLLGTLLIHRFEAGHPIGESYFNAFYFTVITTATIGFGDLVPITVAGKWLTMGYAIFYVPLFLYVMTLIFQSNLQKLRLSDELLQKEISDVESDVGIILDDMKRNIETTGWVEPGNNGVPKNTQKPKRKLIAKK